MATGPLQQRYYYGILVTLRITLSSPLELQMEKLRSRGPVTSKSVEGVDQNPGPLPKFKLFASFTSFRSLFQMGL